MKIIFDSGSTSVAFALVPSEGSPLLHTIPTGHNAASAPHGALASLLKDCEVITGASPSVTNVEYYGAGCASTEACDMVIGELHAIFPAASISVESDMVCAARALCGDNPGIACILGTGANSCLWDGRGIAANVSPLGYILGDEGSGAVIGRLFLGLMFKRQFPDGVAERFRDKYGLTSADIVSRVYRGERPGAFLASFAPFILEEAGKTPEVAEFLIEEFRRFLKLNVASYDGADTLPIGFAGSIAWYFRDYLEEAILAEGYKLGRILRTPLETLASYSLNSVQ